MLNKFRRFLGRIVIPPDEQFTRQSIVYKAAKFIAAEKLSGDYYEFGTYTGNSFAKAYNAIKRVKADYTHPGVWHNEEECKKVIDNWHKMRFVAFDSFMGLPNISGIDKDMNSFSSSKFAKSEKGFLENIQSLGVNLDKVETVVGWFDQSLNQETRKRLALTKVAIAHIDVDLYESTVPVLDFLTPHIMEGTILIFDDWYNFKGNPNYGEQRALSEWLEKNPEWDVVQYQKEGVWRNSFILYLKN